MWHLFAHEVKNEFYHIGEKWWVEMFELDDPIVPVIVEIIAEGKHENETYYGWQDHGKYHEAPKMIQPCWMLFDMCFPYGALEDNSGRILKLKVEKDANSSC